MVSELVWRDNELRLDGWLFVNEESPKGLPTGATDHFRLYKPASLLRDYQAALRFLGGVSVDRVLEIGMWDGGSLALLNEIFSPGLLVGVDLQQRSDSEYFRDYVLAHPQTRFTTHWGVDQADVEALRDVVRQTDVEAFDLIVDDGAHLYAPTKAAFQELFPLLRPGGCYVIEDYGWVHLPEMQAPDSPWSDQRSMAELVYEIVGAMASEGPGVVANVTFLPTLAIIERGPEAIRPGFDLNQRISVRQGPSTFDQQKRRARALAGRIKRKLGQMRVTASEGSEQ
jgi:SAM-dependent methyltransferase